MIIAIYVDDLLANGSTTTMIERFKQQTNRKFEMTDMGKLSYYMEIEVEQNRGCIKLRQTGYAKKIIEIAGL